MNRRLATPLLFFALLFLAACGSSDTTQPPQPTPVPMPSPIVQPSPVIPTPTPGGNMISGNIIAPVGGDISNTQVFACPVANNAFDCNAAGTIVASINQPGPSAPFSLDVQAGQQYAVVTVKDFNGNGTSGDDGDYIGGYPSFDNLAPVVAPASSINITMQIAGGGDGGGGTPTPTPGDSTILGTLSAPAGVDVSTTEVTACAIINEEIDCTNGVSTIIVQSGSSAPYSLNVQAGQPYVVFALKDVNGNGTRDDGDYFGAYPSADAAQDITAPASNIDYYDAALWH